MYYQWKILHLYLIVLAKLDNLLYDISLYLRDFVLVYLSDDVFDFFFLDEVFHLVTSHDNWRWLVVLIFGLLYYRFWYDTYLFGYYVSYASGTFYLWILLTLIVYVIFIFYFSSLWIDSLNFFNRWGWIIRTQVNYLKVVVVVYKEISLYITYVCWVYFFIIYNHKRTRWTRHKYIEVIVVILSNFENLLVRFFEATFKIFNYVLVLHVPVYKIFNY